MVRCIMLYMPYYDKKHFKKKSLKTFGRKHVWKVLTGGIPIKGVIIRKLFANKNSHPETHVATLHYGERGVNLYNYANRAFRHYTWRINLEKYTRSLLAWGFDIILILKPVPAGLSF